MGYGDYYWGLYGDYYRDPFSHSLLPIVSIVVPFGGYLIGSLLYIWLNQKKELQWRL